MTPAARVQAAIELLDTWRTGPDGMDRLLARWGRANRFAGSGDRHAIADIVYDALRRLRSSAWRAGNEAADPLTVPGRDILRGLLLGNGTDLAEIFTGARHAPAALTNEEQGPVRPLTDAPRAVRLDYPDWLGPQMAEIDDAVLTELTARAPLFLRVNTLKTTVDDAIADLAAEAISATAGPLAETALLVTEGQRKVQRSAAYRAGMVEIQDAASQAVSEIANVRSGETVIDLCAGGGGKTLALAASMQNQGRLLAHDISAARISGLDARAQRAGARVEIIDSPTLEKYHGACDLVLVDAPCSGSGAWRRNADEKWRLSPDRLAELTEVQTDLLDQAATLTRPSGRIVYVTCSLLRCENQGVVSKFLGSSPTWCLVQERVFTPLDGGDGFYAAVLSREKGSSRFGGGGR